MGFRQRCIQELRGELPLSSRPPRASLTPSRGCVPKTSPCSTGCSPAPSLTPGRGEGTAHSAPELAPSAWLRHGGRPGRQCLSLQQRGLWGGGQRHSPPCPRPEEGRGRMEEAGSRPGGSCGGLCPFPQQGLCGQCPGAWAWSWGAAGLGAEGSEGPAREARSPCPQPCLGWGPSHSFSWTPGQQLWSCPHHGMSLF